MRALGAAAPPAAAFASRPFAASISGRPRHQALSPVDSPHAPTRSLAADLAASAEVCSEEARGFLAALYKDAAEAAYRHLFAAAQVDAFLRLLQGIVEEDLRTWQRGANESFAAFQEALLAASVERPPRARALFNPVQAAAAADFALKTYYAHFALYKACCARMPRLELTQRSTCDVEPPLAAPPLAGAVQLS